MAGVDVPDDVPDVEVFDTLDPVEVAAEVDVDADDVELDGKLEAGVGVGALTFVTVFTTATLAGAATREAIDEVPSRTPLSRASSS